MIASKRIGPTPLRADQLAEAYIDAKEYVISAGFGDEIDWQEDVALEETTESMFLREAAWVILSSGFRESVVRLVFPEVSAAFLNWKDAKQIAEEINKSRTVALQAFANRRKIDAIASIVLKVAAEGIDEIRKQIHCRGVDFIRELPFMGPITALHLAKNLGVPIAKPDRHLVRITKATGYSSAYELCTAISKFIDESVAVVDLVIWRFATLRPDYVSVFACCE